MSREIKFRIWDKQFKKFCSPKKVVMNVSTGQVKGYRGGLGYCDNWHVEQYTGLKDKNGVEIYEGDILKWNTGMMSGTSEVVYEPACFCLSNYFLEDNQLANPSFTQMYCEVIGNIHQNPELQKV